jgi:hypothetical protein
MVFTLASIIISVVIQSLVGSSRSHLFAYANDHIQAVTETTAAAVKTVNITQTHRDFLYSYAYLFVFVFVAALAALNSVDLGYNHKIEEEKNDEREGVLVEDRRAEGERSEDAAAVAAEKERNRSRYVTRSRSRMQDEVSVSTRASRRNRSPGYRYQGIVENPEYDSTIIR